MNRLCNIILITLLALCTSFTGAQAQQLAFPGADGYAKHITGGRGGKVYYVTSLKDCSDDNLVPGTLRWALRTGDNTPRTILFAVNGTIYLESKLKTNHDNVSILGQSAPGGGICITGYPVNITNRNYIIRYIRFRAGEVPALENEGNVSFSALGIENAAEILLDHCSVTWSMEECLTMFDNEVTTVQHCIIGEGLYHSYNVKTSGESSGRGFAMQWGGEKSNMHHVLIINCNGRSPRFNGVRGESPWLPGEGKAHAHDMEVDGDFANNVIHNWGGGSTSYYGGELFDYRFENAPAGVNPYNRVYMRNNYFRPGPSTKINGRNNRYFINASGDSEDQLGDWYLDGNKFEKGGVFKPEGTYWSDSNIDLVNNNNTYGFASGENYSARALNLGQGYKSHIMKEIPYALSGYTPVSAEQAFAEVTDAVKGSGACLPRFDEVDKRLLDQAAGRVTSYHTGSRASNASNHPGIIDDPYDVKLQNGYDQFTTAAGNTYTYCPSLSLRAGEKYAVDSDADGMPDAYEEAKGFNKTDAADGNAIASNGYTNLENYLNGLADFTLKNADYQTSAEYVEPGLATRPETVTVTFVLNDSDTEGTPLPAITVGYGQQITIPARNTSVYKDGYTMDGWTDGNMLYAFGESYAVSENLSLHPHFVKNMSGIDKRLDAVTLRWDMTQSYAPDLSGTGIYVVKQSVEGEEIDVRFKYSNGSITLPSCEGAVATITYSSGKETINAVNGKLDNIAVKSGVTSIAVKLPYVLNVPSEAVFRSPVIPNGQRFELIYTNLANMTKFASEGWVSMSGTPTEKSRHSINPATDEFSYYTYDDYAKKYGGGDGFQLAGIQVGSYLHSDGVQRSVMYVKDCGKVRVYVSGSNSNGDYVQLTAIATDNSGVLRATHQHVLNKYPNYSEAFDMELDPDKSYMLVFSSVQGYDMVVTAVKLFDKESGTPSSGMMTAEWEWTNALTESANTTPATAFKTTSSGVGDGVSSTGIISNSAIFYSSTVEENPQQYVEFSITPANGFKIRPQNLSMYAAAMASANGKLRVTEIVDNTETEIFNVSLQNTANATQENSTYNIQLNTDFSSKKYTYRVYFHGINVRRGLMLNSVIISGDYEKGAADEPDAPADSPFQSVVSNVDELMQALSDAAKSTEPRYYIFLKNGTYDFGATALTAVPKNTSLIGESQEGVLVKNCPSATVSDYQNQTPVLFIAPDQNDVYIQDMTICQSRDWADKTSQGQALAIRQRGKRAIYKNVTMQGVQDTYYINKADASAYLEDCTVAGEVDFIYGDGTAYFKNCRLQPVSSSACITAPNTQTGYMGLVFDGCVIEKISDAKDGVAGYRLGRPWGDSPAATYLNTTMQVLPADAGWGKMSGGLVLRFHEYGSKDAAGNPLDLSKRSIDACSPAAGSDAPVLTAEQAAAYTVENIFKKVAADWTPAQHAAQLTAPTPDLTGQTLAWKPVSGALCYAIVQNGKVVDFTTATTYTVTDTAAKYAIRVANQMGGLSAPSADATTGIENVVQDSGMEDAPLYNIAGQRVSRAAKGIVIRGGKKLINR